MFRNDIDDAKKEFVDKYIENTKSKTKSAIDVLKEQISPDTKNFIAEFMKDNPEAENEDVMEIYNTLNNMYQDYFSKLDDMQNKIEKTLDKYIIERMEYDTLEPTVVSETITGANSYPNGTVIDSYSV